MAADNRIREAFDRAKKDFQKELKNPSLLVDILATTSIEKVYDAAEKLQKDQARRGHLRHLRKIEPYLDRLRQYTNVINTFVQVKPDVLALIWGPIMLLLQISSNLTQSFDAIRNIMADIGDKLPLFEEYTQIFESNERIKDALCLFFQDILDFYLTALNFFSAKRWALIFESVWPRHKLKIDIVAKNIESHGLLMSNEVNLEHIREAHDARIKSLEHYERTRKAQENQDFDTVVTHLSAKMYDGELHRLRRATCDGTGRWLQKEKSFSRWIDPEDTSTRLVWLQGIPGAGKSHLSAMVVEKVKSNHTLFAFLSYNDRSGLSTISILHSLIIQLVTDDKDLRVKLCEIFESNRRDVKGNPRYARETLSALLKCAGQTHIVVDGLDEADEFERQMTLHELLAILNDTQETKLLISSRNEDDIAKLLKDSAETIRVDHNNAGCVQAYIMNRTKLWFNESDFHAEACSEIRALLAPLASKANGMFLYARIVMDSVTMCHGLDLIREELRVLPESLEDAYARNIQRLNQLQPSLRERARRLLGWIGCSPVPLTRHELEQALCITPGRLDQGAEVHASLNFVKLCGPIVEVIGDHIYFVHFTVKNYLFSLQSNSFVSVIQSNIDLAITCLTYLSLDIFDLDMEDEDIKANIVSGRYRLHGFAISQWAELVRRCARLLRNESPPNEFVQAMECFVEKRENLEYECLSNDELDFSEVKIFKKEPKLHETLCNVLQFRQLESSEWRLDKNHSWTNYDPVTLSYFSVRIYEQLEELLCPESTHTSSCDCSKLRRHYGTQPFKCPYFVCYSQRLAFETKDVRDSHARRHGRPYKCTFPTCEFAMIGFQSHGQYQKHWLQCHEDKTPKPNQSFDGLEGDEIQPLLFDLVTMGKVNEVRELLPRFGQLDSVAQRELRMLAAFSGPLAMFQLLTKEPLTDYPRSNLVYFIEEAIKGENIDVLNWISAVIPTYTSLWTGDYLSTSSHAMAMSSTAPEIFEHWKEHFAKCSPKPGTNLNVCIGFGVIRSAKSPTRALELAAIWREQVSFGHLGKKALGNALRNVAETTCSVVLAKALLECGADVDFRFNDRRQARTPLHVAATKSNAEAANLMKFLLESGADPNASAEVKRGLVKRDWRARGSYQREETRTPSMERGAQNISKWLGMTWDQLVRSTEAQRTKGSA